MQTGTAPRLRNLSPAEIAAALRAGAITLVDVREDNEWAQARIEGAVHAPLSRLDMLAAGLPTAKPVEMHCLAGGRSAKAVALCQAMGLPVDAHMAGGLQAWAANGLPIIR
jgi:rhodanese-related sulfurtransferase